MTALKKPQSYLLHVLCCLLFISIPILSSPDIETGKLFSITPFQRDFFTYLLLVGFFYANYFYFIPVYYFRRRKALFYTLVILSLLIVTFLPSIIFKDNCTPMPFTDGFRGPGPRFRNPLMPYMERGHWFLFILIFFLSVLLRTGQRLTYIRSEKLKSEVSYLRAQINPHFLFNTLNSLYALTLAKSDDAPEAVLKLSGMMRYVVTESRKDHVSLDKEINYIKNYISLQQLRMDSGTQFTFSLKGDATGKQVAPLVLIPFIENAFKYGLNPEKDSSIEIHIDIKDTELSLNVKNNKVTGILPEDEASGHGMENTKQRLHYLYPRKHKLLIFENTETFEVKLTLNLE